MDSAILLCENTHIKTLLPQMRIIIYKEKQPWCLKVKYENFMFAFNDQQGTF